MALLATRQRPSTSDGSRTVTLTGAPPLEEEEGGGESSTVGALRLHGGPRRHRQRVEWEESVVDNEGCGRKKSKICCIYHRPKRFDESSSEESSSNSDSDSDSDSSCRHGHGRGHGPHSHARRPPDGPTPSDADRDGEQSTRERQGGSGSAVAERNAYEKMPSTKNGKTKANPTQVG